MATRKPREYFQLSQDDRIIIKKMEILTAAVEKVYPSATMLMWRSFVQGIFIALGSMIGFSIALAILIVILTQLKLMPQINNLLNNRPIERVLPLDR